MPTLTVNGIVTSCTDYRDNDRILTLLTIEQGRVDVKARRCRKPTAPLLPCTQPFAYGEYELYFAHDRYVVTAAELKESFYPLREDYERFAYADACAKLCTLALQRDAADRALFSLLYHSLSFLAYGDATPAELFCAFLLRCLDVSGYCPAIVRCANCGRDLRDEPKLYFSAARGGALCASCAGGARPVQKLCLEVMRRILLLKDDELGRVRLNEALLTELSVLLTACCRENLIGSDKLFEKLPVF